MNLPRRLFIHATMSLMSSPLRSLLALLGVVIGSAAIIAMINIGYNAKQSMLRQFDGMGAQTTMIEYHSGAQTDIDSLLELKDRLYRRNSRIEAVAVTAVGGGTLMRKGKAVEAAILGTVDTFFSVADLSLAEGRFTTGADGDEAYAVIGSGLLDDFRKQGAYFGVGDTVLFNAVPITVVGILDDQPHSLLSPTTINSSIITPLHSFRRLKLATTHWRLLAVRSQGAHYVDVQRELAADVKRLLPNTEVHISSPEQLIESIERQTRILTLALGAIGGVSLLVGGIGVMNIMLVSVSERRREIGLRMAVGARVVDIKRQFLTEALILCLLGGCLGLAAGVAIAFGLTWYAGEPFELSIPSVVLGVGISTLVGLFFGYYPAAAAAKLDPVDTLYGE